MQHAQVGLGLAAAMGSTPWSEYMALAQEIADGKPHHGPDGNLRRYQQLAFARDYLSLIHI